MRDSCGTWSRCRRNDECWIYFESSSSWRVLLITRSCAFLKRFLSYASLLLTEKSAVRERAVISRSIITRLTHRRFLRGVSSLSKNRSEDSSIRLIAPQAYRKPECSFALLGPLRAVLSQIFVVLGPLFIRERDCKYQQPSRSPALRSYIYVRSAVEQESCNIFLPFDGFRAISVSKRENLLFSNSLRGLIALPDTG